MKSNIFDKTGIEVKIGDDIIFAYVNPYGQITEERDEERYKVVFEFGCFGVYDNVKFMPLFQYMETKSGEYISNCGNKTIYTNKYHFWIVGAHNEETYTNLEGKK